VGNIGRPEVGGERSVGNIRRAEVGAKRSTGSASTSEGVAARSAGSIGRPEVATERAATRSEPMGADSRDSGEVWQGYEKKRRNKRSSF
jgi:hypothetical protein